jgi:hypothetical protein
MHRELKMTHYPPFPDGLWFTPPPNAEVDWVLAPIFEPESDDEFVRLRRGCPFWRRFRNHPFRSI